MRMWVLFAASFRRQLTAVFGYDKAAAASITKASKSRYKEIIARLPEFEREDQFRLNIVGCAMLCAFILSMPQRPEVERLTDYYAKAMMTVPMRWFCRMSGKRKFSEENIAVMKAAAALKPQTATRIPGTWILSNTPTEAAMRGALPSAASVR